MIACPHCSRANPDGALFCHHEGFPLGNRRAVARPAGHFAAPFVFPGGRAANTFDELAVACLDDWPAAVELMRCGALAAFLRSNGRADLAERAREAALYPDADWALAQLLDRLPIRAMPDAKLVAPAHLDLGRLPPGRDSAAEIRLSNAGQGCLHGTVSSDAPWLSVSRGRFGGLDECAIGLHVVGPALRASLTPLEGRLTIESSGGTSVVTVRAEVPPVPFAAGVLSGARTPRQSVERASSDPREAGRHFESGAVARWYESNGWAYPVKPGATGSALDRYCAALGLPPLSAEAAPVREPTRLAVAAPAGWRPIARDDRSPRPAPPPVPIRLRQAGRPRSRAWLLALLPLGVLLSSVLAGVGVALSLPARQPREGSAPVAQIPAPEKPPAEPPVTDPAKASPSVPKRYVEEPPVIVPQIEPPPMAALEIKLTEVEVVFCIDTTGSMGGLIRGAQQKIWSICNQIAGGKPTPTLRVGLVAYRDRDDEYVTKVTDLSRDLDAVQQELLRLSAAGGGDLPESVNQALDDAVNRVTWSKDKKTLKIIFLVGDAAPHMDYKDDVKYPETCRKAADRGILINAVQCGVEGKCKEAWQDIAAKAGGEYVAIAQAGGVRVVGAPQDERLAAIVGELMDTALIYGDAHKKKAGASMIELARVLRGPAAADRAAFAAKSKRLGPYDLIDDLAVKRVRLEDVKGEELPEELKHLDTLQERRARVAKLTEKRAALHAEALGLEKERATYLDKMKAGKDGFDVEVLKLLRKQAKKFDIAY